MEPEINITEERIRDTAKDMFMMYGIRNVTMDDLAVKLGMSKKTIYQYYKDKDALVKEVLMISLNHNREECNMCTSNGENAVHELFLIMDSLKKFMNQMNPAVIHELKKYHPEAYESFTKYKNNYLYSHIRQNLERGINEGFYRSEMDVEIVTKYRLLTLFTAFEPVFYESGTYSLIDVQQEIFRNFIYGLLNNKGYKVAEKVSAQYNQQ